MGTDPTAGRRRADMNQSRQRMRRGDTLQLLERALALSEEHLRQGRFATSEAHLAQLHAEAHQLYSLALAWPEEARVRHLALCAALLRKGLSVGGLPHLSRTLTREMNEEDRKIFDQLCALRHEFSTLRLSGPGALCPDVYQRRLETLATQSDALEEDLATRSALLHWLHEQPPPTELPRHVAAALPKDGALVEFVAFRNRPLTPEPALSSEQATSQPRYLALLLFADGCTQSVDLGPAEPLDAAALLLHRELTRGSAFHQRAAQALYEAAIHPLRSGLRAVRRLFITPDGWLALVPFAELHDGERFLSDAFAITQLSSGRDLLPAPETLSRRQPVILLTGLDPVSQAE